MKKVLFLFCLLFALLLGGCDNMGDKNKSINTLALEYMEKKYAEPFEYAAPTGDSLTGTRAMLVRCQSLPEAVYVEIENYLKADERVFRDNYIAVKYKQETIDFLLNCAVSEFGGANVFYDVKGSALSDSLPSDAGFSEFLSGSGVPLAATIEVKDDGGSYKELTEKMANRIAETGASFRIILAVVAPDEFGIYNEDELGDKVVMRQTVDSARLINVDGNLQITWSREE